MRRLIQYVVALQAAFEHLVQWPGWGNTMDGQIGCVSCGSAGLDEFCKTLAASVVAVWLIVCVRFDS